jgi:deoxyribonucleoside regulator
MTAGAERTQLLIEAATLYYEQGFTQEQVASKLSVSRSNVSRLLTEARKRGIVEIRVRHAQQTAPALEEQLKERFGLEDAYVLVTGNEDPALALREVGAKAAEQLRYLLRSNTFLAIGWGRALYETVNAFRPVPVQNVHVVQMMGGVGALNPQMDGAELARRLAEALGGQFHYLRAPFLVESPAVRKALLRELEIDAVIEMVRQAELALTGIGSVRPHISGLARAGYVSEEDLHAFMREGAVGDICGLDLHQRVITIDPPSLRDISCVMAIAAWREKAPAILGALRGGYVDILVTDDAAATEVLRLDDSSAD